MEKSKILVIGSSNMDTVIDVPYLPAVGETIMGDSMMVLPGGKGANQAYAAAMLGGDVIFLSVVGDDESGMKITRNLRQAGVDVSQVKVLKGKSSGMTVIYVADNGSNSIVYLKGANGRCNVDYMKSKIDIIEKADIIMLQMEVPEESVYYAVNTAKQLGKMVILNPAPAPVVIPDDIYQKVDFLTPNETELQKLSGIRVDTLESAKEGCRILLKKGIKNIIVTLGSNGALLVNQEEATHFNAAAVKAVDSTAAGDTFNAAFAVYLSEGNDYHQGIEFANMASAIAVSRKGAQASIPDRKEVMRFIAQIG